MTGHPLRRELWRHNPTGQIWAVEVYKSAVRGVAGPLGRAAFDPVLMQHLLYETRYVDWIQRHRAEFTEVEGKAFDPGGPLRKAPAKASTPAVEKRLTG
jgi:hypothetical protein